MANAQVIQPRLVMTSLLIGGHNPSKPTPTLA
jgi:hypothetical protein